MTNSKDWSLDCAAVAHGTDSALLDPDQMRHFVASWDMNVSADDPYLHPEKASLFHILRRRVLTGEGFTKWHAAGEGVDFVAGLTVAYAYMHEQGMLVLDELEAGSWMHV